MRASDPLAKTQSVACRMPLACHRCGHYRTRNKKGKISKTEFCWSPRAFSASIEYRVLGLLFLGRPDAKSSRVVATSLNLRWASQRDRIGTSSSEPTPCHLCRVSKRDGFQFVQPVRAGLAVQLAQKASATRFQVSVWREAVLLGKDSRATSPSLASAGLVPAGAPTNQLHSPRPPSAQSASVGLCPAERQLQSPKTTPVQSPS